MKITNSTVKALIVPIDKAQSLHFDDAIKGFGIRVLKSGTKSFVYDRKCNGRTVRVTLGRYPAISADDARKLARKAALDFANGINTNEQKRIDKELSITLIDAALSYFGGSRLKEQTKRQSIGLIRKNAPSLLNKPIFDISPSDIEKTFKSIKSEANANGTMRIIRAIYNAQASTAQLNGETVPPNPVRILSIKKLWYKAKRKTSHVSADQLAIFWDALTNAELELRNGASLFKLLLLTGLRVSEAQGLRWKDVDLKTLTFTVLETKNTKNHTLPITKQVFTLMSRLNHRTPYVFDQGFGLPQNFRYLQAYLEQQTSFKITPHDLRRTYLSIAAEILPSYMLKRIANHANSGDVTAGYVIKSVADLREPMQKVEDLIFKLISEK